MAIKTLKNTVKTTENLIADAVDILRQTTDIESKLYGRTSEKETIGDKNSPKHGYGYINEINENLNILSNLLVDIRQSNISILNSIEGDDEAYDSTDLKHPKKIKFNRPKMAKTHSFAKEDDDYDL